MAAPHGEAEPPKNEAPTREELEAQLKKAVAEENFEEAARIRDVLRGKKNA